MNAQIVTQDGCKFSLTERICILAYYKQWGFLTCLGRRMDGAKQS
ncbi:hypothetical protein [Burkholderia cepacia]|nr:hypothetical protein [Burkholderia cepacia]